MARWNKTTHPISDIRDWRDADRLELRPSFQRRAVWSATARIMLIDTILRELPMPKIFLATTLKDEHSYRVVIDGQQRISAILDFLNDGFSLKPPYYGAAAGKYFSELDTTTKSTFLHYSIDFNEATDPTDPEIREVYARVNKYTVPLTKQELRRADFPGHFLDEAERLASDPFFDEAGVFSIANRRRYADAEYASELLSALIDGIQDKRNRLDSFYLELQEWDGAERANIHDRFKRVLRNLRLLFREDVALQKTRFRQKADFYSIFLAVDGFLTRGYDLTDRDLSHLRSDLALLDYHIAPESEIDICREYAVKCVSQANSAASRRWRRDFLSAVLHGTFTGDVPDGNAARILYRLQDDICGPSAYCPSPVEECQHCGGEIARDFSECVLGWEPEVREKQLSNASWIHQACVAHLHGWAILNRCPEDDATPSQ